jgi:predicted HicB family RNase H-like nuclease
MKAKKVYKYPLQVSLELEKPLKKMAKDLNLSINQLVENCIKYYLAGLELEKKSE